MTPADQEARSWARAIWQYGEPVHAITYYGPERRAATDALGLKGGWMSYFGCRAAPLGAAAAPVVSALFYVFHPQMVARAIPDAWSYATPAALLDARLSAIDAGMRRVLGDDVATSGPVARAAELAAAAVAGCDMSGKPMGAANQAVPEPDEPHLRLWQALTAIREHRGDGHVDRLVDAGVSPAEALVLQAATGRSPEDGLRANRGWSADEWSAAAASLAERWLVDGQLRITAAGAELRQSIEDGTDRLAAPPGRSRHGRRRRPHPQQHGLPLATRLSRSPSRPPHRVLRFGHVFERLRCKEVPKTRARTNR